MSNDIQSPQMVKTNPNDSGKPCLCFPGQCRGQVVDGKQPNGDICKQEYAESDEAWFDWDVTTLPTSPAQAGAYIIGWELNNGYKAHGEARDPAWSMLGMLGVKRYRWIDPRVMVLNPYTGQKRNAVDIMQDPEGRLVVPPAIGIPPEHEAAWREVGEAMRSLDAAGQMPKVDMTKCPPMPPVAPSKVEVVTDPADMEKTLGDHITDDEALHVVRNPFGWSEDSVRRARLFLADRFEKVKEKNQRLKIVMNSAYKPIITPPAEWDDLVRRHQAAITTLEKMGYAWRGGEHWAPPIDKAPAFSAPDLLDAAAGHMRDRAKTYDKPEGERSMGATVQAFNAITGRDLRESEGWLLMSLLKMVRSETRDTPHRDSVEDLIAYAGLYGEARLGGV